MKSNVVTVSLKAITDYLTDEGVTARRCYEDMLAEVDSWIAYHACNMKKAEELGSDVG